MGTLDALLAGDGVDLACVDARRGEVFCKGAGIELCAIAPDRLAELLVAGTVVAGDGAVRYRDALGAAHVPADGSPLHVPWARHHAALRQLWADPDPCYVRAPDAERSRLRGQPHDDRGRRAHAAPRRPRLDRADRAQRLSTPWSRSMFAGELAKPSGVCLGAFQGEDMLGYLIVARYVDAWHVMNVAVDEPFRGRGIAGQLLQQLFERTGDDVERGYTLEVRVSNGTAIGLYRRLGFVETGIRRGYYTDNREDALIMWRDPGE